MGVTQNELLQAFNVFRDTDVQKAYSALVSLYQQNKKAYSLIYNYRIDIQQKIREGKGNIDAMTDALHALYVVTAQDYFDDFMIACEWNRSPNERFWLPRRKQLLEIATCLQALVDDELDELFISQPPRTGKTTLVQFFTVWYILKYPEKASLYVSFSSAVTKAYYEGILEILNDPYTYAWKDVFPTREVVSTNALDTLLNIDRRKKYASMTCRSIDGTLNGATDANGLAIADDLHEGIEEALSPDRLAKKWATVENNYHARWKEGCKRLWIGTRWSVNDCISHRIDFIQNDASCKNVRFKVINRPALNEKDESNFDYLYGVGFSTDEYKQRRASFERNNDLPSWFAQYCGNPIERGGCVFLPDDMRYFNGTLPDDVEPDNKFICVDPAWGGGDFVAAPVCYQYGSDIYVVDVIYNNSEKKITQPLIVNKAIQWEVAAISIEATKATSSYTEGINKELKDEGYSVNVQSHTKTFTGEGKSQRIFNHAPDIREHFIFLDSLRSREYELFMNNVYGFKMVGKNKHDDAPDSLSMACEYAFGNKVRSTAKVMRRLF